MIHMISCFLLFLFLFPSFFFGKKTERDLFGGSRWLFISLHHHLGWLLVNYPGHFLLTNLLLDKMKETSRTTGIEGRIVNLSSIAHLHTYEEGIRFDKINDQSRYAAVEMN